jgi:acetyltransferase-like isoleucine patch superfamily enzyme
VIAPVTIGSRATIGEKATVMGDVEVGEGATVLAHTVLLPGTRVGARERWGGVPARRIEPEEWEEYKRTTLGALR